MSQKDWNNMRLLLLINPTLLERSWFSDKIVALSAFAMLHGTKSSLLVIDHKDTLSEFNYSQKS